MRTHNLYFTLVELIIVIAIIAILASILLPALGKAKEKAKSIHCVNNQKQLGTTLLFYEGDYDEYFPNWKWQAALTPYISKASSITNIQLGICPAAPLSMPTGAYKGSDLLSHYVYTGVYYDSNRYFGCYGRNYHIKNSQIVDISHKVLLLEAWVSPNHGGVCWGSNRLYTDSTVSHGTGANILFADGHVDWLNYRSRYGSLVDIASENIIEPKQLLPKE